MKKNLNIDSTQWCDVVFENRNKSYGAYALRQSSDKRHLVAFGAVVLLVIGVMTLPAIMNGINAATGKTNREVIDEEWTVMNIPNYEEPIVELPQTIMAQPQKKIAEMAKFTPPLIVEDNKVDESEIKSQSDLLEIDARIGKYEVPDGSKDFDAIDPDEFTINQLNKITETKSDPVFDVVESMPVFPGGENELNRYISSNIKYPVVDQENNIQGRVTLRFVVDKNGNISDVSILKGVSPNCDREAVRVVKSMPKWIPGRQNGTAVNVYFTLPIIFRLQN